MANLFQKLLGLGLICWELFEDVTGPAKAHCTLIYKMSTRFTLTMAKTYKRTGWICYMTIIRD